MRQGVCTAVSPRQPPHPLFRDYYQLFNYSGDIYQGQLYRAASCREKGQSGLLLHSRAEECAAEAVQVELETFGWTCFFSGSVPLEQTMISPSHLMAFKRKPLFAIECLDLLRSRSLCPPGTGQVSNSSATQRFDTAAVSHKRLRGSILRRHGVQAEASV